VVTINKGLLRKVHEEFRILYVILFHKIPISSTRINVTSIITARNHPKHDALQTQEMHTSDIEATLYWNFKAEEFALDV
jgi:hypothetical protein